MVLPVLRVSAERAAKVRLLHEDVARTHAETCLSTRIYGSSFVDLEGLALQRNPPNQLHFTDTSLFRVSVREKQGHTRDGSLSVRSHTKQKLMGPIYMCIAACVSPN